MSEFTDQLRTVHVIRRLAPREIPPAGVEGVDGWVSEPAEWALAAADKIEELERLLIAREERHRGELATRDLEVDRARREYHEWRRADEEQHNRKMTELRLLSEGFERRLDEVTGWVRARSSESGRRFKLARNDEVLAKLRALDTYRREVLRYTWLDGGGTRRFR